MGMSKYNKFWVNKIDLLQIVRKYKFNQKYKVRLQKEMQIAYNDGDLRENSWFVGLKNKIRQIDHTLTNLAECLKNHQMTNRTNLGTFRLYNLSNQCNITIHLVRFKEVEEAKFKFYHLSDLFYDIRDKDHIKIRNHTFRVETY